MAINKFLCLSRQNIIFPLVKNQTLASCNVMHFHNCLSSTKIFKSWVHTMRVFSFPIPHFPLQKIFGTFNTFTYDLFNNSFKDHQEINDLLKLYDASDKKIPTNSSYQTTLKLGSMLYEDNNFYDLKHRHAFFTKQKAMLNEDTFKNLMHKLESEIDSLNVHQACHLLASLIFLGLDLSHSLVTKLHSSILFNVHELELFDLLCLSVTFSYSLGSYYIMSKISNKVFHMLEKISHAQEMELVSCILLMFPENLLLSQKRLFVQTVEKTLKSQIKSDNSELLLTIASSLSCHHMFSINVDLVRWLFLQLDSHGEEMNPWQIQLYHQNLLSFLEPRSSFHMIKKKVENIDFDSTGLNSLFQSYPLYDWKGFFTSKWHKNFNLPYPKLQDSMQSFYAFQRIFQSAALFDKFLVDKFWKNYIKKVENFIETEENTEKYNEFSKFCHGYLYFKINYEFYQNRAVEEKVLSIIKKETKKKFWEFDLNPSLIISFIIGFSKHFDVKELNQLLKSVRVITRKSVILLSRGIKICKMSFESKSLQQVLFISKLCGILDVASDITEKNENPLQLFERSFLQRHGNLAAKDFVHSNLNIQHDNCYGTSITSSVHLWKSMKYVPEKEVNRICEYIIENAVHILPTTFYALLVYLHDVGFHPDREEEFGEACRTNIEKCVDDIPSWMLICLALRLCYLNAPSTSIIHKIFGIDFLGDHRIGMKLRQEKLRNELMELNREICISHPHEKVPWFHGHRTYSCDINSKTQPFFEEVQKAMKNVLGSSSKFSSNAFTTYGHYLDFEFVLDSKGRVVPYCEPHVPKLHETTPYGQAHQRCAVLLRPSSAYESGYLHGSLQLQKKQLEILAYTVVEVPIHRWQNMSVQTQRDKEELLGLILFESQINL